MNLDLVMMNSSINPAICKTLNYKEEVYSKFAKEVIQQESEASKEKTKNNLHFSQMIMTKWI